ncbi:PAS domain S-box protein [Pleomorphovibrio marinus]|uniref:PAS domain S-box protein n=1 Tax=Pleomorphovibrio marinus TaxID=2164132 RepID=UPI000E0B37F1|nr:PAS domain S-box protein [Pleomorphovibrio marinus]
MIQNQYSTLFLDQTKDLIWEVDKNLLLVYANKAYLTLMKEVTGMEKKLDTPILVEGFGEGYIEKWKAYYQRALSGESFEIEENFYDPATEEMQYGQVAFSPIRDEGGEILTVACRSTDITSIIRQKDHASRLMDASLDVFCTISEDGKFVFVSAASEVHWGYAPDELIGTAYNDLILEEDLEKTDWVAAEIVAGKEFKSFSNRYRMKNGDIAYNLWSARWDPETKLMYCVARDSKEKIEEDQRLKLLEKVINSTTDAILITEAEPLDEPGPIIVYANEAFTKMTGYTTDEVIGKNPRLLQGPDSNSEELRKLGEKLRRWESSEITVLNYTKTGEPFWVNFAVSPVANEKGWFTHWISVQRNVTEQKKQEAEKELLSQISLSFNNEVELIPAVNRLCENLHDFGKFDLIELWCPNMERTQMQLIGHSSHNKDFYELEPTETSFKKDEGLPGKVWKQGKQLLWDAKQINKNFIRKSGASTLGLQAIIGIPLTFNDELVGILLVGTKRVPGYLEQHNPVLSRLEKFIGSEINRKRLEDDLKHLYQAIPDILCIADFNGRFLNINPAGCELLGYKEEEILFHYFDEFVHPEDMDVSIGEVKKLEAGATTFQFENRYITKEGKIVWLNWSGNTSIHEGLIYASAKNITTEVQLRELNAQAGSLAKIGSWEIDLEKDTVFWSKIVHQLHETDPGTFIPNLETAINFYREDFRAQVHSSIEKSITTEVGFDFEAVIVTKKLKERWVRAIGNVEFVHGKATRLFGSFQDITDLKESELRLQSFANNLPGVAFQYFLYPDGRDELKYVTDGAKKVWGFGADSVMEDNNLVWKQIELGGEINTAKNSIKKAVETRSDWKLQWRYIMPTNELRIHAGYGSPNFLPDGTVVFNSLIIDITQEYRSEELLEQASEMAKIGSWELNLTDQENDSMYWSPMTRDILEVDDNYDPSLTGGFEFYSGEEKEKIRKAVAQLIEAGQEFDLDLLINTPAGKEKWIRCMGKCERVNNKCTKIYGSYQDIHAAKANELRVKEILDSISDAFYAVDADWNFTYFNREAENLLNKSAEEVLGRNIWEIFSPAKGTYLEEVYRRVASSGQSENFEYLYPGNGAWYEATTYPSGGGISSYFKNIDERKKAAQELERAYRERSNILESISDNFYALNSQFDFSYMNESCAKLLQIEQGDIFGKNLYEEFPEIRGTEFEFQLLQSQRTNKAVMFEFYYEPFQRWFSERIYPTHEGFSIYFFDVTDVKEAEKAILVTNELLAKSNEEKTNILESIGDAFFAIDEQWTVTYWNKQAETILGKLKEDIVGKNLWKEFPDAIDTDFYRQYHRAMETGKAVNFEEYYPTLNIWVEVTVYPSENGLSIYFKDITLRKAADIRLVAANERFELVTKATNDAIWDWDIENDVFNRSDNIHKILGNGASTKLKKSQFWQDAFHPEDLGKLKESIQSALNDPQSERWEMEYRVLNENDEELSIIDRGIIVRNKNGKAARMVGAMTDLTKQKKLEKELFQLNESLKNHAKELERSNEELEQFAFITSHDMQEPLRMISSFMDQLKRKYADKLDDKGLQYIHFATDGAKRMKQIILDLLLYSRANRPNEQLEEVSLDDIVSEYTQLRRKLIAEKNAVITFDALPILHTYRAPITQVVHCLLDNALKYVKENVPPRIEISTREKETMWEFAVKDNGIGIDKMFFDKIFIIFQRLHNRSENDGTGIGLSIAKRSVEFLGGEIWLESTLGEGSTFYFTIEKNK